MDSSFRRGDVRYARLPNVGGSVQYGFRPILILSNEKGCLNSPIIICSPLTSKQKKKMPTHVEIKRGGGLSKDSVLLLEQILTVDRNCIETKLLTRLPNDMMFVVDKAISVSLGMDIAS